MKSMAPRRGDLVCYKPGFSTWNQPEVIRMQKKPAYAPVQRSNREPLPFEEQLRRYQAAGVEITFANANLSLEDIVKICTVREKGEYMCDFVADEGNYIVRIDLNHADNEASDMVWDGIPVDPDGINRR